MTIKSLDLIVLENDRPKRLTIAQIVLESLPYKNFSSTPGIYPRYFGKKDHHPTQLTETYIDALVNASEFYQQVAFSMTPLDAFKATSSVPISYATEKAYNKIKPTFKKEKWADRKFKSAAHFTGSEIIVSLAKDRTLFQLKSNIIHETGHYFHKLLKPKRYDASDMTMIEVIAIFTQRRYDFPTSYRKNTQHHRASELLDLFRQYPNYDNMSVKDRWEFLASFTDHEKLEAELKQHIYSKHF